MTSARLAALLVTGLLLSACGADGVPETPPPPANRSPAAQSSGGVSLSTSGYARVGVSVSRNAMSVGDGF